MRTKSILGFGFTALMLLAGCQNESVVAPATPAAEEQPAANAAYVVLPGMSKIPSCAVVAPVCTEGMKTYLNKCQADAAHAKILFNRACPRLPSAFK